MSASFDETARHILRETDSNGGLNTRSLFDLMVAAHDESQVSAEYQRKALSRIASHLESEAGRVEEAAAKALRGHVAEAHVPRQPRRASDPEDMDWRATTTPMTLGAARPETIEEGDIKRAWRIGKWVLVVVGAYMLNDMLLWLVEKVSSH